MKKILPYLALLLLGIAALTLEFGVLMLDGIIGFSLTMFGILRSEERR